MHYTETQDTSVLRIVSTVIGKPYWLPVSLLDRLEGRSIMIQAIRSIFGENVRTDEPRIMIDGLEFTFAGVRAIVANLRARNEELELSCQRWSNKAFALTKENDRLRKESLSWVNDWIKSDAQRVDIKRA